MVSFLETKYGDKVLALVVSLLPTIEHMRVHHISTSAHSTSLRSKS
jgi:hypothetical protein